MIWVFFFIKMKKFKEKFKNFRVWELGNTDRKLKISGHSRLHVDKSPGYFEDFLVIK